MNNYKFLLKQISNDKKKIVSCEQTDMLICNLDHTYFSANKKKQKKHFLRFYLVIMICLIFIYSCTIAIWKWIFFGLSSLANLGWITITWASMWNVSAINFMYHDHICFYHIFSLFFSDWQANKLKNFFGWFDCFGKGVENSSQNLSNQTSFVGRN